MYTVLLEQLQNASGLPLMIIDRLLESRNLLAMPSILQIPTHARLLQSFRMASNPSFLCGYTRGETQRKLSQFGQRGLSVCGCLLLDGEALLEGVALVLYEAQMALR